MGADIYRQKNRPTDVPALSEEDAEEKAGKKGAGGDPAVCCVRGGFVQIALV
jgi:ssRNA-specific RNase YbeY (16S rRNA maturation enzyme)